MTKTRNTKPARAYMIGLTLVMPFQSNADADEIGIEMVGLLRDLFGDDILDAKHGSQALDEEQRIEDELKTGFQPFKVTIDSTIFHSSSEAALDYLRAKLPECGIHEAEITVEQTR